MGCLPGITTLLSAAKKIDPAFSLILYMTVGRLLINNLIRVSSFPFPLSSHLSSAGTGVVDCKRSPTPPTSTHSFRNKPLHVSPSPPYFLTFSMETGDDGEQKLLICDPILGSRATELGRVEIFSP